MGDLTGKTALITGGGTGIGRAIAARFHEEGAFVAICGRRRAKLDETVRAIAPDGERLLAVEADVTSEADIARLIAAVTDATGQLDILVNNAGAMRFDPLDKASAEQWDLMMNVNARAAWRVMAAALPVMKARGGGSMVTISSIAANKALPNVGLYGASKAAIQHISQVLALEAAPDNIRVNCLCPALVEDTELSEPIFGAENVADFWARMKTLHPLGRNGTPRDVAEAALFFASDKSAWITGVCLELDGGRHLTSNRPA